MSPPALRLGFVPLLDAAPIIVAREMGFAEAEGLALELCAAPSWSSLRDMVLWGQVEAAQMLAPIPVAIALGLVGPVARLDILQVLSVNGDVLGVSSAIETRLRGMGFGFDFVDAKAARAGLAAAVTGELRIGVPFPFSTHAALVRHWLAGEGPAFSLHTIPPPQMAEALAAGEIDAFCVGEPWGSVAVERGVGALLLPGAAIWAAAPEKVLAARHDWIGTQPETVARLMRAVWQAGRWMDMPANRATVADLLARSEHVNAPPELLDRALSGQMVISTRGEERRVGDMIRFHAGAAAFPWRSQAAWFACQLARIHGLDVAAAVGAAMAICRTDLYRANLRGVGADLPGASSRIEGALDHPTAVASERGTMILPRDVFFDRAIFDPTRPDC
ncbi:MAG: ABC transporter substrate-binding protein [Rhodobacteraceae bacterium]|nr:ABC transporter substrate-binding protein [Paracoccaceae bacterium]